MTETVLSGGLRKIPQDLLADLKVCKSRYSTAICRAGDGIHIVCASTAI